MSPEYTGRHTQTIKDTNPVNTTATEIPSPAAMPRVCMRPSLPRRSDADTVRVTLTVESAPDTAFSEQPTCVACAAVDGDSSGVLTGPHGAVLDSLIRWLRTTPPFQTAHCSPALYVHRASGTETAEDEADAVFDALFRARMLPRSVEFPACPDPATLSVRPVVRGHCSPDVVVLPDWSSRPVNRTTALRVPSGSRGSDTDSGHTTANPFTTRFTRLTSRVRRSWTSSAHSLLCTGITELERLPRHLDIYTDASTGPSSRYAGFGIVCPELSMVASGVLPRSWSRQGIDSSLAEVAAVAAAAELFGQFIPAVTIHCDSVSAVTWWRKPRRLRTRHARIHDGVTAARNAVSRTGETVRTRWVKGHADSDGNGWADRAARLAWRSADWDEPETVRQEKFDRLAEDVRARLARGR